MALVLAAFFSLSTASAASLSQEQVLSTWYGLILKLVRHTATYSPPLASRNFAYLGVASYEAIASGDARLVTLAGQLHELKALPQRQKGKIYNEAIVLDAALAQSMVNFFGNTGPSGQNALRATLASMWDQTTKDVPPDVARRSKAYGQAVAAHIFAWSQTDGGAHITNMGFPLTYQLQTGPGHWQPTNQQAIQHVSLLPDWLVGQEVRQGQLIRLFSEYDVTGTDYNSAVSLLYPSRQYLPLKVRVFNDFLIEKIKFANTESTSRR